jgi:hypothetical protein
VELFSGKVAGFESESSYFNPSYAFTPCGDRGKNSPTVAHACRKRRLKLVLGAWGYNWATQFPGDMNMETWSSRLGVGAPG